MPRLKIEVHAVLEYDAAYEDYGVDNIDEMVAIDQESAEEDVYMFLDQNGTDWTITVTEA